MAKTLDHAVVTGATGYVGGRLVARLASAGVAVTAVTRPGSDARALETGCFGVGVVRHGGDVGALADVFRRRPGSAVFHLAGMSAAAHRPDQVAALVDANVRFGAEVLEAAALGGCGAFVAAGTFWQRARGDDGYAPNSLYAATKQAFQDVMAYYAAATPVRTLTLSLFDVYGPDDPRGRLLDLLLDAQADGRRLDLTPGHQKLDLVHADDVCAAFERAAVLLSEGTPLPRADYAVATGRRLTLREVVRLVEREGGALIDARFGAKPYRPGEVMEPWDGPRLPGWRAVIGLEEGVRGLLAGRGSLASAAGVPTAATATARGSG